ncbi:MAG TPA: endonuclease/exonuclease/phosphatase family protein [Methanocella sp.]|nr:endonuclease/exonuclease/phosphatase family protein [Methanocella sp.]
MLTWNIRFGGIGAAGYRFDPKISRENVCQIAGSLLHKHADIIVLAEYRDSKRAGEVITTKLTEAGYTCYRSNAGLDKNGILIALSNRITGIYSVSPANSFKIDSDRLDEIFRYRWLNLQLRGTRLKMFEILGIHIPDVRPVWAGDPERFAKSIEYKQIVWDALIGYARERLDRNEDAIITGDFNTVLNSENQISGGGNYYFSDRMAELEALKDARGQGLTDAWRAFHSRPTHEDFTWYNEEEGYRLDYTFLTPGLTAGLKDVEHSHSERLNGLSDHSILAVDLDL